MEHTKHRKRTENTLTWWQLALLGVASTIGTGYFLGSSLGIRLGGPAVLISFVLAAIATFIVFDVLARMTAEDPREGSFRSYAKKPTAAGQASRRAGCTGARKCLLWAAR